MKGYTATIWVDVPYGWDAERVREEVDAVIRHADSPMTLNTVHTPKPDAERCPMPGHGDHAAGETY